MWTMHNGNTPADKRLELGVRIQGVLKEAVGRYSDGDLSEGNTRIIGYGALIYRRLKRFVPIPKGFDLPTWADILYAYRHKYYRDYMCPKCDDLLDVGPHTAVCVSAVCGWQGEAK